MYLDNRIYNVLWLVVSSILSLYKDNIYENTANYHLTLVICVLMIIIQIIFVVSLKQFPRNYTDIIHIQFNKNNLPPIEL